MLIPLPDAAKQDKIIADCEKCSAAGKKNRWNDAELKDALRVILLKYGVIKG